MSQFHERKLILPFLSALAGETIVWEDNACRKGRLRKYLFYGTSDRYYGFINSTSYYQGQ